MQHSSLQDVLSKVGEDDLGRAAKKAEEDRAAWKALRAQQPQAGLTAGELTEQLSMDDEEDAGQQQEILTLKQQEKKDVPKTQRAGFFPPPPGK